MAKKSITFMMGTLLLLAVSTAAAKDEPKQTAANTVSVHVSPVKPQVFPKQIKFFVNRIVDRSGSPQPLLAYAPRGGVFFDREPAEMVREALEDSLKLGEMMASDSTSADYVLDVYIFQFGLSKGSGFEFFAKAELSVVVKNVNAGKTETVPAMGTSIQNRAVLKSNIQKNVTENVEESLQDCIRNLLRGVKLREAVTSLQGAAPAATNAQALSKNEILQLLKGEVPSAKLALLVKERGLGFSPTADDLADIRKAGGQDDLMAALQAGAPAKP
jgi:hypothetical protein